MIVIGNSALRSRGAKGSSGGRTGARLALQDTEEVKVPPKTVSILKGGKHTDSPPSASSHVPTAGAVAHQDATSAEISGDWTTSALTQKEAAAVVGLLRGYDERAEDAAHLVFNRTARPSRTPNYAGVLLSLMSGK